MIAPGDLVGPNARHRRLVVPGPVEGNLWQSRTAGVVGRRDDLGTAVDGAVVNMPETFPSHP